MYVLLPFYMYKYYGIIIIIPALQTVYGVASNTLCHDLFWTYL
jgi:hypothetical protein